MFKGVYLKAMLKNEKRRNFYETIFFFNGSLIAICIPASWDLDPALGKRSVFLRRARTEYH